MGTRLLPLGLPCCELANRADPRAVQRIHRSYVLAGATVHLTNTFQANPLALDRHGLEPDLEDLVEAAIRLARLAGCTYLLGNVGPIYTPGSPGEFVDREALVRTIAAFTAVDGLLLETCSSPNVLGAIEYVTHRVPEIDGLPVLCSFTFLKNGRGGWQTLSGHPPGFLAAHASRHHVAALGVNCGRDLQLDDLAGILRAYRQETDLPLFVRPNAGPPGSSPIGPERFQEMAPPLVQSGARLLGGCCGTDEQHIAALARGLQSIRCE